MKWKYAFRTKDVVVVSSVAYFTFRVDSFFHLYVVNCRFRQCGSGSKPVTFELLALIHRVPKKGSHFYFLNSSVKHLPILIIFGMQHQEETA